MARAARRHEPPTDCPHAATSSPQKPEKPPALERVVQVLVIAFTVLLATAAYYLGIGDANTVNKLAQWACHAEPSSPTR